MRNNSKNISSNWQIKAGAIMSYIGIIVNMIAGMVYTPWIIRNIGQSGYGLFTLASSLISMFMVDFGISAAVSKFLAQYITRGENERIGKFLGIVLDFRYYNFGNIFSCIFECRKHICKSFSR